MVKFFRLLFVFFIGLLAIAETVNADNSTWESIRSDFNQALAGAHSGASPFQESVFGKTRLISSKSGIKDTNSLFVGIEVLLNEGWTIKQPTFTINADPYQGKIVPLFRADVPTSKNWTEEYEKHIIFPIILNGHPEQDITVTVSANWLACPPNDAEDKRCIPENNTYTINLPVKEAYDTIWRANILSAARMGAFDIKDTPVKVSNTLLNNGDLLVHFQFPQAVKKMDIRSEEPYQLSLTGTKPNGKIWMMRFRPTSPIKLGDIIPFSLRTTIGCYTMNLTVAQDELPFLPEKFSIGKILWIGFFFFLLSPLWSIWLKPQVLGKTPKTFNKNLLKLRLGTAVSIGLLGCMWMLGIDASLWIHFPGVVWIVVLVLLYLIIHPILPISWACLGIILLPKPFGDDIVFISNTSKIVIMIWCFVCCYIPFNCWKINVSGTLSYFKKVEKEKIFAYGVFIRLPYLILCGWLILAVMAHYLTPQDENTFTPPIIIRVTEPICLKCAHERMTVFSHIHTLGIHLKRLDSSSPWAYQKRKEHLINRKSFNLLIWEDGREVALPPQLSRAKLDEILKQRN